MSTIVDYIREAEIFDLEALEKITGIQEGKLRLAVAHILNLSEIECNKLSNFLKAIGFTEKLLS